MNHTQALIEKTAEKYLLGELTAAERDEFEAHYFSCQECAEDIKAGATLVDNAREVFRAESKPKIAVAPARTPRVSWWAWFQPAYAAAAMMVLIAAVLFQNLVTIPRMKRELSANRPQVQRGFTLRAGGARSNAVDTIEAAPFQPFGVFVDIPSSDSFSSYTCRVQSESGMPKFSLDVSAADARDTLELYVPASTLTPGRYVLVVYGHATSQGPEAVGTEVARYPFTFQSGK
jgi:hypothetical protein